MKNETIIIEAGKRGRTAYRVGFNADGSDFKCFVWRGSDAEIRSMVAQLYPAETHTVTIVETTFAKWIKGARA